MAFASWNIFIALIPISFLWWNQRFVIAVGISDVQQQQQQFHRVLTSNQQNLRSNQVAATNHGQGVPRDRDRTRTSHHNMGRVGPIGQGGHGHHGNNRAGVGGGSGVKASNNGLTGHSHNHIHGHIHNSGKVKLSMNQTVSYSYGVDLPSFAFDYSEYITGATIVRSSSTKMNKDLHLMIYLLGHRAIYEDYPFEAISTDFDSLHAWQKAITHWPKERNATEAHRSTMYCIIQNNNNQQSQHRSHGNKPYMVPAQWLHISLPSGSAGSNAGNTHSNFNRHIDVLRCKLKNTHGIYSSLTTATAPTVGATASNGEQQEAKKRQRIFVDLIRKEHPVNSKSVEAKLPHSNDIDIQSQSLVISFNVAWDERQSGYGGMHHRDGNGRSGSNKDGEQHPNQNQNQNANHHVNSRLDMWYGMISSSTNTAAMNASVDNASHHRRRRLNEDSTGSMMMTQNSRREREKGHRLRKKETSSSQQHQPHTATESIKEVSISLMKMVACVSGIRPLQTPRPEVSLPMVIEYIEGLLSQGIAHIVLGIQLHPNSFYFYKYRAALSVYIEHDPPLVTLISTALTTPHDSSSEQIVWDDVAGFTGVQLQDEFADLFFVNQCLVGMKGMAEYVLVTRINQFIVPMKIKKDLSSSSSLSNTETEVSDSSPLYEQLRQTVKTIKRSASLEKVQQGSTAYYQSLAPDESSSSVSPVSASSSGHHSSSVSGSTSMSLLAESLSIEDAILPACSIRLQTIYGVNDPEDSFAPWGPGDTKWVHDFYRISSGKVLNSSKTAIRFFSTRHTAAIDIDRQGNFLPVCYAFGDTVSNAVPVELILSADHFIGVQYKESHSTESFAANSEPGEREFPKQMIDKHFESILQGLQKHFLITSSSKDTELVTHGKSVLAYLKTIAEKVKKEYEEEQTLHEVKYVLKDRREIKPPFWQPCNTEHLAEVMTRVFASK